MEKAFQVMDHTADVGIIAYGTDIKQMFSNAALGLFSLITEPESIGEKLQRKLEVVAEDKDSLLVEWLNELIYLFDAEHLLFGRFDIDSLTGNQLKSTCYGEKFDPSRHKLKLGVKAATYHMLKLDKHSNAYRAHVLFDI
jgi:SHS2 domain-containing protein